jgi:hypothetical protein
MKRHFTAIVFIVSLLFLTGCVEERFKEISTTGDGTAEVSIPVTQSAKLLLTGYNGIKLNCGSQISIQISLINKDVIKDHFIFVDKGNKIEDLKPMNVRSGDYLKVKITDGCPNSKYVITYNLDSGS